MEAKFTYESLTDILIPKAKEDIAIPEDIKILMEQCYNLATQFPNKIAIIEELDINCKFGQCYYGFEFIKLPDTKSIDNYKFTLEYDNKKKVVLSIYESRYREYYSEDINSPNDFIFKFDLYNQLQEGISDILKPKHIEGMDDVIKFVNEAYQRVKNSDKYRIEVPVGFLGNEYTQSFYGFQFLSSKLLTKDDISNEYHIGEIGEHTFGYWGEEKEYGLTFENSGHYSTIEDMDEFIYVLGLEKKMNVDENLKDILKPKPKEEIEPAEKKAIENAENAFEWAEMEIENLIKIVDDIGDSISVEEYNSIWNGIYNGISVFYELPEYLQDQYSEQFEILYGDLMELIRLEEINESLFNILKPKSEEELKIHFEKENWIFVKIFKELFPEHDYNFHIAGDGLEASFSFSETDNDGKIHTFLISQNKYQENDPRISYLDTKLADDNIGGFFLDHVRITDVSDIKRYVRKKVYN